MKTKSNRSSGLLRANSGTALVESPAMRVCRPGNFSSTIFLATRVYPCSTRSKDTTLESGFALKNAVVEKPALKPISPMSLAFVRRAVVAR